MTIREIAKLANVSAATVSRVINRTAPVHEETRKRIEAVMKANHYQPCVVHDSPKKETETIGVFVPNISNPFFIAVIGGIRSACDRRGMNVLICDTNEDPQKESRLLIEMKQRRVRGIVITPVSDVDEQSAEYLDLLKGFGIPVVLVDREVKYSNFDGVFIDNARGAFDAVTALLDEGHRDIAIITGPQTSAPGRDRLRGYCHAFRVNGIPVNEQNIYPVEFRMEDGYRAALAILKRDQRPTAIFSCNNLITLGVLRAIRELQLRVPDAVALIGFDEIQLMDILKVPYSHVTTPDYEIGEIAMSMLIDRIDGKEIKSGKVRRVTLRPHLVLQGTEKLTRREAADTKGNLSPVSADGEAFADQY